MSANFLSYVPYYVARDVINHPTDLGLGVEGRFNAVTLFADVSGFTAMSEALGKSGRRGTEELTQILNSYFDPMIALVKSYGGIIGKFGGDAMTIMFPYTEDTQADAVRRGLRCALDMQRDMVNYEAIQTSQGVYGIAMKAGLGMGNIYTTIVGDASIRLEFIIAGKPIDDCADAEHHATRGEVVTHNDLLPFAPDAIIAEDREGFSLISDMEDPVELAPLDDLPEVNDEAAVNVFRRYVHPVIADRLDTDSTEFIDEHRRATVLFVSFTEFNYDDDPSIGDTLQTYFDSIINIIHRYDGYVNKIDMGDKGSKFIVLFGTPTAHENDEERALRCALEISEVHGIRTRIGVNTGSLFAGRVGSPLRQEYTVMGDAVNLSARLMQFAKPGQIIVSGNTREFLDDEVRRHREMSELFTWDELEPIMVKGKTEPISVSRLVGVSAREQISLHEPNYALPMVGREAELEQVRALLDAAAGGAGHIIGVQGEAGIGKSRFNAEVIRIARDSSFTGYGGAAQSFNSALPYVVWSGVWKGIFNIDPAATEATQIATLQAVLEEFGPALVARMPLLGPVLSLPIPETPLTATLDPSDRTDLLHNLLLTVLRNTAAESPVLLVLEDTHWIDPASRALLDYIGRNMADLRVLLVMLYRPPYTEEDRAAAAEIAALPHFTEIDLGLFSEAEAGRLINLKLEQLFDGASATVQFVDRVTQRSQGNPFYIDELMNLLHDRQIDVASTNFEEFDLPDSLQQLILSRIDGLQEDEKSVIKVASIIGRVFRASWVYGSYPQVGVPQFVIQRLNRLGDLELTPLDRPEPELEYLFRHLLTQEVAYGTMAFAVRTELHERVAAFIENRYQDNLARYYDVIAYHYGLSENENKQREYFQLAGDQAKKTYALPAAQYYYERLLPLIPNADQAPILLSLGEVLQITGDWETAEELFRRALTLTGDPLLGAHIRASLGDLLANTQGFDEAITVLQAARSAYEALNDQAGVSLALKHLAYVYIRAGDLDATREAAEAHVAIAETLFDRKAMSEARTNLGMVAWYSGDLATARDQFEAAIADAEEVGYTQGALYAQSNRGAVEYLMGNIIDAADSFLDAMATAQLIGYVRFSNGVTGNLGNLYKDLGDTVNARRCYIAALDGATELGDWPVTAFALENLAQLLYVQGDYETVEQVAQRGAALARLLGADTSLAGLLLSQAEALAARERYLNARPLAEEASAIAKTTEDTVAAFDAALLLARIEGRTNGKSAESRLNRLRADWQEDDETAAIDYTLWQVTGDDEPRTAAASRYLNLYTQMPIAEYRTRYLDLGGDASAIAPMPELPGVSPDIMSVDADLDTLLARVDARLAEN